MLSPPTFSSLCLFFGAKKESETFKVIVKLIPKKIPSFNLYSLHSDIFWFHLPKYYLYKSGSLVYCLTLIIV